MNIINMKRLIKASPEMIVILLKATVTFDDFSLPDTIWNNNNDISYH